MARKRHTGPTGFKSKAQWRLFWANPKLRRYARRKAHATAGPPKIRYRRLPERKHAVRGRRRPR